MITKRMEQGPDYPDCLLRAATGKNKRVPNLGRFDTRALYMKEKAFRINR
jgi:hypothetical protein